MCQGDLDHFVNFDFQKIFECQTLEILRETRMVIVLINYLLFHFSLIRALKQGNISNTCNNLTKMSSSSSTVDIFDHEYPGTSVIRMNNVRHRVRSLTPEDLNGDWINVRRKLLWAGGLKDLEDAAPGQGYTGHSFNDFNHCDLTTMLEDYRDFTNDGKVAQIHYKNALGAGIRIASIEELGPGGSWTTCMIGCNSEPPRDVAHLQFHSRIAFKLVWYVLVIHISFSLISSILQVSSSLSYLRFS